MFAFVISTGSQGLGSNSNLRQFGRSVMESHADLASHVCPPRAKDMSSVALRPGPIA